MKKVLLGLILTAAIFFNLCGNVFAHGHFPKKSVFYVETDNGFETSKIGHLESGVSKNFKPVANKRNNYANMKVKNLKKGESSVINVMGLVEVGDGSVFAAAKQGKINKVHYIDRKCDQINAAYYFFFRKVTTIVYGE